MDKIIPDPLSLAFSCSPYRILRRILHPAALLLSLLLSDPAWNVAVWSNRRLEACADVAVNLEGIQNSEGGIHSRILCLRSF